MDATATDARRSRAVQTLDEVALNPVLAKDLFEIPAALRAGAQPPVLHDVEYQWIFRRMLAGGLLDTNELGFDPRMGGLRPPQSRSGCRAVKERPAGAEL